MKTKGPVTRLKEVFKESENQIKDLKDKYLRALAELDNYRKRAEKDMEDHRKYSKVDLFIRIIPVLDNLDRAISGVEINGNYESFYKGLDIIYRQFKDALKALGLVEYSGLGELFNPARHEAVGVVETDAKPENTVIEEISKGYMVGDKVIKPAKVLVARLKKEEGGQENVENNRN
jgi:molecular chaperone GrpE